ncbi:MAG TPA: LAGLIDADG family homing endonuclease [Nitrososphaerales archaeon]|nr:LAGLIDADG family homing endonuclease [Nitrososphaerales archaeon]
MNFRDWISLWFSRTQAKQTRENAIIVPNYRVATGEYQPENIRACIDAYLHDEDIFNAINFISNAALSQGFYVTGDEDYWNGKVVDLVEDFNRSIRWGNRRGEKGLAELLRIVTKELLYGGNTFIEMLTPLNLQLLNQVELSSIYKIYRNEVGDINQIQQLLGGRINNLDPDTIIHIPWLQVDREAYGRGLIQPLVSPRVDIRGQPIPALYRVKASLEFDIYRMIHRKGVPRSIFSFPEAGDELVQTYTQALKDPDVDASFSTNTKVNVATEQGGPAQGIANLIVFLDKRFQAGLQTPINNLLNSSGYTEACYSEDTLTLTENGWKHFWQIGENERIATFNPDTERIEFYVPEARLIYDYDGEMLHFRTANCDVLVTPGHTMYFRTRYWNKAPASYVAIKDQIYFKTNGDWPQSEGKETFTVPGVSGNGLSANQALEVEFRAEPWLRFVAYYVTEGAIRVNSQNGSLQGVSLSQKKPSTIENMRRCLKELGIPFSEYPDRRYNAIEFAVRGGKRLINAMLECGKGVANKRLPRKYIELPREQLCVLLDALLECDGTRDSRDNRFTASYFTVSEGLAQDVQEIAMRIGYDAFIHRSQDPRTDHVRMQMYRVSIHYSQRHETKLSRGFAKLESYKGKVYCFTVKNHLFLTMRNGKPTIQGNSARVAEELGGLIVKDLQLRLKHAIETELYDRIIIQAGLDPKKAKIELHWGSKTEPDYQLQDVWQFFDRKLITVSEARKILRKVGWELDDDTTLNQAMPTATVGTSQQIAIPTGTGPESPTGNGAGTAVPQVGLISPSMNPNTQANAQGLAPSQVGQEQPVNPTVLKKVGGPA